MDLTTNETSYDTSKDNIIIVVKGDTYPGGRTADTTALPTDDKYIIAGHPVIEETATKKAKLLGVTDGAFVSIPSGHTVLGVVVATVPKEKPLVAVMYNGTVNEEAYKNVTGLTYTQGIKDELTLIKFLSE